MIKKKIKINYKCKNDFNENIIKVVQGHFFNTLSQNLFLFSLSLQLNNFYKTYIHMCIRTYIYSYVYKKYFNNFKNV